MMQFTNAVVFSCKDYILYKKYFIPAVYYSLIQNILDNIKV